MPCPEVQYFLDCSLECGHIAGDVHSYFMSVHPNADVVYDDYAWRPPALRGSFRKHWNNLQEMGLHFERGYLEWRDRNRVMSRGLSYTGHQTVPSHVEHLVENYAALLVDSGFDRASDLAMLRCDQHFGWRNDIGVLKRACRRQYHDLDGYDEAALASARVAFDVLTQPMRERREAAIAEIGALIRGLRDDSDPRDVARTAAHLAAQRRAHRSAMHRSKEFLRKLVGKKTTRLFLRGTGVQVEGLLARYEIAVTDPSDTQGNHGSTRLTVLTREGDIELCRLCIYTKGVPVLDHVASLIMHIRAGEEEKILEIGNAYQVREASYDQPWLLPYLPKRSRSVCQPPAADTQGRFVPKLRRGPRYIEVPTDERPERLREMSGILLDRLKNEVGIFLPDMPSREVLIRTGEFDPEDPDRDRRVTFETPAEDPDDVIEGAMIRGEINTFLRRVTTEPAVALEFAQHARDRFPLIAAD